MFLKFLRIAHPSHGYGKVLNFYPSSKDLCVRKDDARDSLLPGRMSGGWVRVVPSQPSFFFFAVSATHSSTSCWCYSFLSLIPLLFSSFLLRFVMLSPLLLFFSFLPLCTFCLVITHWFLLPSSSSCFSFFVKLIFSLFIFFLLYFSILHSSPSLIHFFIPLFIHHFPLFLSFFTHSYPYLLFFFPFFHSSRFFLSSFVILPFIPLSICVFSSPSFVLVFSLISSLVSHRPFFFSSPTHLVPRFHSLLIQLRFPYFTLSFFSSLLALLLSNLIHFY